MFSAAAMEALEVAGASATAASTSEPGAPVASMQPPPPMDRPMAPNVSVSSRPRIGEKNRVFWSFSFAMAPVKPSAHCVVSISPGLGGVKHIAT